MKLDARLMTIAEFVREDTHVFDIGTDHGFIPAFLKSQKHEKVTATDINLKPLNTAKNFLEKEKISGVNFILSDGFEKIEFCQNSDYIIAGMGGETIAKILSGCKFLDKLGDSERFILQPMTKHEKLRRELYKTGFEIISEKYISANSKNYIIIYSKYTGKKTEINYNFENFGYLTDSNYIENQLYKIKKRGRRYMPLIRDIYNFIDSFAPFKSQSEFDNSGLLIGDFEDKVRGIFVILDMTLGEPMTALEKSGANLVITHHPVIFHPIKKFKQTRFLTF